MQGLYNNRLIVNTRPPKTPSIDPRSLVPVQGAIPSDSIYNLVSESGDGLGNPGFGTQGPGQSISESLGLSQSQSSMAQSAMSIGMQAVGIPGMVASPVSALAMTNNPNAALESLAMAVVGKANPQVAMALSLFSMLSTAFSNQQSLTQTEQEALAQVMENMNQEAVMDAEMGGLGGGIGGVGIGAADGSIGGLGGLGSIGDSVGIGAGLGGLGALGGIGGIGGIGGAVGVGGEGFGESIGGIGGIGSTDGIGNDGIGGAGDDGEGGIGDGASDGGGAGDGGDGGGTVICTVLHSNGLISDGIYKLDAQYGKLVDPIIYAGYRKLADPLVILMTNGKWYNEYLVKLVFLLGYPAVVAMAASLDASYKASLYGKFILRSGTKLCRSVGNKFFGENLDDRS